MMRDICNPLHSIKCITKYRHQKRKESYSERMEFRILFLTIIM